MARISRLLTFTAVAVGTLGMATTAAGATGWTVVSPPATAAGTNDTVNGAYARTDGDVWAVGSTFVAAGAAPAGAFAMHWNGSTWSTVATPAPGSTERFRGLIAVSASAAADAWAVGFSLPVSGGYSRGGISLYEHWDGTAWTAVTGPNIGELVGVADFGAGNAWAVSLNGEAARWNGTAWSTVAMPAPDPSSVVLDRIAAFSADGPNDMWAVGTYSGGLFSLHYDGTAWSVLQMAQPVAQAPGPSLHSMTALSPSDVWAVGEIPGAGLVEHFDGTTWQIASAPPNLFLPTLTAVAARSASDVWVFGNTYTDGTFTTATKVFAHWNGTSWSESPSPFPVNTYPQFSSAAASPNHVWLFGTNTSNQPLIVSHS